MAHRYGGEISIRETRGNSSLQIFGKESVGGKVEPERRALESQPAGTGVQAPRQPHLSNGGIQQAPVGGCVHVDGNSKLIVISFFELLSRLNPRKALHKPSPFKR